MSSFGMTMQAATATGACLVQPARKSADTLLATLAAALPVVKWPQGTRAPVPSFASAPERASAERHTVVTTVVTLALAAFLCCACMGVPVVHMATFVGAVCGSPTVGINSLVIAMVAGAVGRVSCGLIADKVGPLMAYAIASTIQTACVLAFPTLGSSLSFMVLSAIFGFGFAGNMTCLSLCVRQAVPVNGFGGAIGFVMMFAWAGMAAGGFLGGVLFDATLSYTLSFVLAWAAGILNLAVLGALALTRRARARQSPVCGDQLAKYTFTGRAALLADNSSS